jgi:hypothetical protein
MAWVCCCSGIAGSIPVGGMYVYPLWVFCVIRYRFLRRADHSSRGVLSSIVCLSVIVKLRKWGGPGLLGDVAPWAKKNHNMKRADYEDTLYTVLSFALWFFPHSCSHILRPAPLLNSHDSQTPDNKVSGVCASFRFLEKRHTKFRKLCLFLYPGAGVWRGPLYWVK